MPDFQLVKSVKKDVVFSTECVEQKPLDSNTQLVVEYSIRALESKYYGPGTTDEEVIIKQTDAALSIIIGCCTVGSFIFPPAAGVLGAIAFVGGGIQLLVNGIPIDRNKEQVALFKKLEKAVHELQDTVASQFAEFQSFVTEHNFDVNITTAASTLLRYLRNCMEHLEEGDVEHFRDAYEQNPPLIMAYSMISLLENQSTNPLLMAIGSEKIKTRATFEKWRNIIMGLMSQFVFIEGMAVGLLNRSNHCAERLSDKWYELEKAFEQWKFEFTKDDAYWEDMKTRLKPIVNHSFLYLDNKQTAMMVRKALETYLTRDSFYVIIFDDKGAPFATQYDEKADKTIVDCLKGKRHFLIYRSRTANQEGKDIDDQYNFLHGAVTNSANNLKWEENYTNVMKQLKWVPLSNKDGLTALFDDKCNVEVEYVHNPITKRDNLGPGHYSNGCFLNSDKKLLLLSALP